MPIAVGCKSEGESMSIYDQFGVRTIINAKGPATRLSGGILDAEVTAAMTDAASYCVDMAELQASAGKVIAELTGAEAGLVTSGAAAGLLLGTAACLAGMDLRRMDDLPFVHDGRNEVVVQGATATPTITPSGRPARSWWRPAISARRGPGLIT